MTGVLSQAPRRRQPGPCPGNTPSSRCSVRMFRSRPSPASRLLSPYETGTSAVVVVKVPACHFRVSLAIHVSQSHSSLFWSLLLPLLLFPEHHSSRTTRSASGRADCQAHLCTADLSSTAPCRFVMVIVLFIVSVLTSFCTSSHPCRKGVCNLCTSPLSSPCLHWHSGPT